MYFFDGLCIVNLAVVSLSLENSIFRPIDLMPEAILFWGVCLFIYLFIIIIFFFLCMQFHIVFHLSLCLFVYSSNLGLMSI